MARTIFDRLLVMPAAQRVAVVGFKDDGLLALRELGPAGAAAAGFRSWACPDYLAGALGVEYRCPDPPGLSEDRCRRCAAAFLQMRL